MKKINFQDLPSTDTPIKASTLNKMQSNIEESCVAVSPTQPETNERVWIQKGKNLFNKNNAMTGWISGNGTTGTSTVTKRTGKIKIKANTDYIFSYDYITLANDDNREYCLYDKDLNVLTTVSQYYDITTKQFVINSSVDGYVDISYDVNCTNVMVEQGSTATEYEAYVDKKIWCKNNNGVFEELLNKSKLQTKTIWSGNLYETGTSITLSEPLKVNNLYIFTFYGLSSTYLEQVPFTYRNGNFQKIFYDGSSFARMRLNITDNGSKISVNSASINNSANTALIAIEKV